MVRKVGPRRRFTGRNAMRPLRQPRQERFARAFAETLSLEGAAREAGYPREKLRTIASRLLAIEAMQKRIRHLQREDPVTLDPVKLVQSLHLDPRAMIAKAFFRNPFTGNVGFDLGRLSPQEVQGLELRLTSTDGRLGSEAAVSLHSGTAATLAALARIVGTPSYAPERQNKNDFNEMLREMMHGRSSKAPIRK